jgi:hypothetical protein
MKLRTKIAAVVVAGGATLGLMAAPAAAGGYGKQIKDDCRASYGQLVSAGKAAARSGGHPAFTPSGARGFVENEASFALHCGD